MTANRLRRHLVSALLTLLISLPATFLSAATLSDSKDSGMTYGGGFSSGAAKWTVRPALNAGYNKLLTGYDGYDDLGKAGLDIYFRRQLLGDVTGWTERMIFRLS